MDTPLKNHRRHLKAKYRNRIQEIDDKEEWEVEDILEIDKLEKWIHMLEEDERFDEKIEKREAELLQEMVKSSLNLACVMMKILSK